VRSTVQTAASPRYTFFESELPGATGAFARKSIMYRDIGDQPA